MTSLSSVILSEAKNLYSYRALAHNSQTDALPKWPQSPTTSCRLQLIGNPGQQVRECSRQTDGLGGGTCALQREAQIRQVQRDQQTFLGTHLSRPIEFRLAEQVPEVARTSTGSLLHL